MLDVGVYYVTGGLGSGKSAAVVNQLKQGLIEGRRVVTNLDLTLENLVGHDAKQTKVMRIPDHPTIDDLNFIGDGYDDPDPKNYDESRFGIIALDELGTWFNSREWNKPGRREVVNWLLHARKRRWILLLIIQDLELLDNQARAATAKDFVVYCSNMSKFSVPLLNPVYKAITGRRLSMPTFHLAIVKNGFSRSALVSDRWVYSTKQIRTAYNTRQIFIPPESDDACRIHSMLPPWLVSGRYRIKKDWAYYMAKLKQNSHYGVIFSGLALFIATLGLGFSVGRAGVKQPAYIQQPATALTPSQQPFSSPVPAGPVQVKPIVTNTNCTEFLNRFSEYRLTASYGTAMDRFYSFEVSQRSAIRSYQLEQEGFQVRPLHSAAVEVKKDGCLTIIRNYNNLQVADSKPENNKP